MRQTTKIQALITGALTAVLLLLAALPGYSQQQQTREEYIEKYKDAAIQSMKTHGIPASITLAQGCLESADGNSDLAVRANNHFGIKCHNDWKGPTYYKKGDDRGRSCYRKYRNPSESFKGATASDTHFSSTCRSLTTRAGATASRKPATPPTRNTLRS